METLQSIIIWCITPNVLFLAIWQIIEIKQLKKDRNRQKALVSGLRHRLGDKQDDSKSFIVDELKEIFQWLSKKLDDLSRKMPDIHSPMVDNTTKPPQGYQPADKLDISNPPRSHQPTDELDPKTLQESAHLFLMKKGVRSISETHIAYEIERWLIEFAESNK